jgi:hypothetical protein
VLKNRIEFIGPIPLLLVLVLVLVAIGCSRSPFETAPVHGTVTIDGVPFSSGKVVFFPAAKDGVNAGKSALGVLQPDGSFVLSTYANGDGAVVGDHSVTIIRSSKSPSDVAGGTAASLPKFDRMAVPGKFTVVAGQENVFDLQITARDVARFDSR